jgi:hypothetical protein
MEAMLGSLKSSKEAQELEEFNRVLAGPSRDNDDDAGLPGSGGDTDGDGRARRGSSVSNLQSLYKTLTGHSLPHAITTMPSLVLSHVIIAHITVASLSRHYRHVVIM